MAHHSPFETHLDRLLVCLRHATDFTEPIDLFHRTLGGDPLFLEASRPTRSAFVDEVVEQLHRRVLRRPGGWAWLSVFRYEPRAFVHGAASLGGQLTFVCYFEREDLGLACASAPGGVNHMMRFRRIVVPSYPMRTRERGVA